MADNKNGLKVVPLPASENQAEHDRIRRSNGRDQELERQGEPSGRNQGYYDVADVRTPALERVVDE